MDTRTRAAATTKFAPTHHERFLAAIVESADDAIFAKSLEGRILSWNAGAERMYGYRPDEIVGDFVHRLAPPERRGEIDSIMEQIRAGQRIEHYQTVRVRRNGEQFPVSLAISPVRDEEGTIIGASTVARDITEQQRLGEALGFQKSLLTAQAEASLDGILIVDPADVVLFQNRRLREMWGIPPDVVALGTHEAILKHMRDKVHAPKTFVAPIDQLRARPADKERDEVRLRDGRVFDRYSAPVLGPNGQYYGRVWSFRDVTVEYLQSAQLRAVIEAMNDAAFVCGSDGHIVLRNPAASRLFPEADSEAELQAAFNDQKPDDEGRNGDSAREPDEFALSVNGTSRRFRLSRKAIPAAIPPEGESGRVGNGSILVLRDVTELREAEASREAFMSVLSHELRTPITTIFGAAKMLQRRRPASPRADLLTDIEAESDRLYRLVEDLLVLTRIERGGLELADEPVLIGPIVQRVVAAERGRLPYLSFEVDVDRSLPIVRGDDTYVEQILRNLVGNAVKYGPPEGTVTITAQATPHSVIVRILDEGPGIPAAEVHRVFDLLYRSPATAAQAAGSGIGLFVSRRLAEAMGGGISARPRKGRGAEFALELRLYETSAD